MAAWQPPDPAKRPIVVFGGTVTGRRIACTWVAAGFNVNIQERDVFERPRAIQYVVDHVKAYMKKIGSTKQGIISAAEDLDAVSAANPWLVIEALANGSTPAATTEMKTKVFGALDDMVPEDCIICTNSLEKEGIFRDVKKPWRALVLHHYLTPNVRVIEMVKSQTTKEAIVNFLFEVIPKTGALPILANDDSCAGLFQPVWHYMRERVCRRRLDLEPRDVDEGWDQLLQCSLTRDIDDWFLVLDHENGDVIEMSYTIKLHPKETILDHLNVVLKEEGKIAPYRGVKFEPLRIPRPGPNIYFVDIGHLESVSVKCGRILCGSTDGGIREIVTELRLPYGLSIHLASKQIFWTDIADGTISSCSYNGSKTRIIVPKNGDAAPKQIVIDQQKFQIYWTQSEGTQIRRCNIDGTNQECILDVGNDEVTDGPKSMFSPVGITLDPAKRYFYWSRPSPGDPDRHLIQRAPMESPSDFNPSKRHDVETLFENLPPILDLDFVPFYDEIYWSIKKGTTTEIHRGYVGPCPDLGIAKQKPVIKFLRGMGWLKVDAKTGHFYATCVVGTLNRYDMTTGKGELQMYSDENGAFAGISLMYGDLDWTREPCNESGSEERENDGEYKSAKGRIVGTDGADSNYASSGTLSTVSKEEGDMDVKEPLTDTKEEADADVTMEELTINEHETSMRDD